MSSYLKSCKIYFKFWPSIPNICLKTIPYLRLQLIEMQHIAMMPCFIFISSVTIFCYDSKTGNSFLLFASLDQFLTVLIPANLGNPNLSGSTSSLASGKSGSSLGGGTHRGSASNKRSNLAKSWSNLSSAGKNSPSRNHNNNLSAREEYGR